MAILAIISIVTINMATEMSTSVPLANPIITRNGMQNGDDIGNKDANRFSSLVGFIMVK